MPGSSRLLRGMQEHTQEYEVCMCWKMRTVKSQTKT